MLNPENVAQIIAIVVPLTVVFIMFVGSVRVLKLWAQAKFAKVPINLLQILEMRFRKCNPRIVVHTLIMAKQAGIDLSLAEVQAAYPCLADLQKISTALVQAKAQGVDVPFRDLVETDLRGSGRENGAQIFREILGRIKGDD